MSLWGGKSYPIQPFSLSSAVKSPPWGAGKHSTFPCTRGSLHFQLRVTICLSCFFENLPSQSYPPLSSERVHCTFNIKISITWLRNLDVFLILKDCIGKYPCRICIKLILGVLTQLLSSGTVKIQNETRAQQCTHSRSPGSLAPALPWHTKTIHLQISCAKWWFGYE